jgi:hypothetical protein
VANYSGGFNDNGSITELNASTGAFEGALSGAAYHYGSPHNMALVDGDLFVANFYGGPNLEGSLTEVNASSGAVVDVVQGPSYHFAYPDALAVAGHHLFVANYGGKSIVELPA